MNKLIFAAFGLAAVLVACPDPVKPPMPQDNVAEAPVKPSGTAGSVTDLVAGARALETLPTNSATNVQNQVNSPTLSIQPKVFYNLPPSVSGLVTQISGIIKSGKLQSLAVFNNNLPRGDYNCLAVTVAQPNCVRTASDDFKVTYTNVNNATVVAFADWDNSTVGTPSAPQIISFSGSGNTNNYELPTKANFYLQIGTIKHIEAAIEASYEKANVPQFPGSSIMIDSVGLKSGKLQGVARNANGDKAVIVRGFTYDFDSTNKTIKTTGDISVVADKNIRARWDFEIGMTPDANNPFGFTPLIGVLNHKPNGNSKIKASLEVDADVYAFAFDTSNLIENPFALTFTNGFLFQKGKTATFAGVFDNPDLDCVPGENLNVTTASGTQNLETIIRNNFSVGCTNK